MNAKADVGLTKNFDMVDGLAKGWTKGRTGIKKGDGQRGGQHVWQVRRYEGRSEGSTGAGHSEWQGRGKDRTR